MGLPRILLNFSMACYRYEATNYRFMFGKWVFYTSVSPVPDEALLSGAFADIHAADNF